MAKPLVIDLFCGLGGWSRAFLDEGWDAIGFDIERHDYGTGGYPGQLVLQDVLTLDGRQFRRRAALMVASPPCQEFSYMAMPWSRAKAKAAEIREDIRLWLKLTCLFNACFRIAHEAQLPIIVENVRGAEPWVGSARWHYGSFYFWGDVPALMPKASGLKLKGGDRNQGRANGEHQWNTEFKVPGFRFDGSGKSFQSASVKVQSEDGGRRTDPMPMMPSKSPARKAASAMIAMIPYPLAQHIARVFKP